MAGRTRGESVFDPGGGDGARRGLIVLPDRPEQKGAPFCSGLLSSHPFGGAPSGLVPREAPGYNPRPLNSWRGSIMSQRPVRLRNLPEQASMGMSGSDRL